MQILLVEDEIGISDFIKQGLEEESYEVTVASNGEKGLELAKTGRFDLLLLDWMLPGMTGLDLLKLFRKENDTTPVIFLTAKDTLEETLEGLQTGANDYIKKPFHFEELLERIRVQLRGKFETKESLSLGSILLNRDRHQVFKSGLEIPLTLKEFALLEYLIQHKNKVCTRSEIISEVWDIHFEYNTGVIDVFINSLRKKLDLRTEEDCIQTVRGIGYIAREL
jgi:DNA-binding response OmpR family regulator